MKQNAYMLFYQKVITPEQFDKQIQVMSQQVSRQIIPPPSQPSTVRENNSFTQDRYIKYHQIKGRQKNQTKRKEKA